MSEFYLSKDGDEWFCAACAPDDSGEWPCGSETDCPQHCAGCGCYLPHPLTTYGVNYVIDNASDEARKPFNERNRIMPLTGSGEDCENFSYWHGSPHRAIVGEWLTHIDCYQLGRKQQTRVAAILRLFSRDESLLSQQATAQ